MRFLPEEGQRADERNEQRLVACVERDVDEDGLSTRHSHHFVAVGFRFLTDSRIRVTRRFSAAVKLYAA